MLSKLATKTVHGTKDDADKLESPKETKCSASESFLRREFKISGQIGEPGQTDKLTFVSLTHQIDSGLKRQYKECEICIRTVPAAGYDLSTPERNSTAVPSSRTRLT